MELSTFPHGIHPREAKEMTCARPIRRFPFAPYLVLFLSQHAGKPAKPIVREGQEVQRGQVVAEADGFVSVPIHAPATGTIKAVSHALDFDGRVAPAMILIPHPASTQKVKVSHRVDVEKLTPQEIVQEVQNMGMVGLGGAAFPTHVKFTPPKGKPVDTLIINGCECEPYLTSDHRVMVEMVDKILLGTRLIAKALGVKQTFIAIEANKPDAIAFLQKATENESAISVRAFKTKYPQGAEKMITKALMGKEIPSGGLPADIGTMISNVATAAEIGTLLPEGRGLIERVVTISGEGVKRPGNYLIPIGTPLDFILDEVGLKPGAKQVIFGGPMMGKAVTFLETPTIKGLTGIVVMSGKELAEKKEIFPCIRCSECVQVCPIHLNPSRLGILARKREYDSMAKEFHLFDCFECGCCSYVCPSNIPLVQYFRLAKNFLRHKEKAS